MSIDDWTRWGDAHPFVAGVGMMFVYALCILGYLAIFAVVVAIFAFLGGLL